jgi:hypothetical protein
VMRERGFPNKWIEWARWERVEFASMSMVKEVLILKHICGLGKVTICLLCCSI